MVNIPGIWGSMGMATWKVSCKLCNYLSKRWVHFMAKMALFRVGDIIHHLETLYVDPGPSTS